MSTRVSASSKKQLLPLIERVAECVLAKGTVGFQVTHVVVLKRGLVSRSLGDMDLARTGFADDEPVLVIGDELERLQFETSSARQLWLEAQ